MNDSESRPRKVELMSTHSKNRDDYHEHFTNTVFIRIKAGLIYTQGINYMPGSAAE